MAHTKTSAERSRLNRSEISANKITPRPGHRSPNITGSEWPRLATYLRMSPGSAEPTILIGHELRWIQSSLIPGTTASLTPYKPRSPTKPPVITRHRRSYRVQIPIKHRGRKTACGFNTPKLKRTPEIKCAPFRYATIPKIGTRETRELSCDEYISIKRGTLALAARTMCSARTSRTPESRDPIIAKEKAEITMNVGQIA